MKQFKEPVGEISENPIPMKKHCEVCGKPVKQYQTNYDRPYKFVFINITQEPPKHYFCSKKCKNDWIFSPGKYQVLKLKT